MIERLLSEISAINKKYALINQKTGAYFNIFDIVDKTSDEVFVCRFLYELLNPKGVHYQGAAYLRLFVSDVLRLDFTEQDFNTSRVYKEYSLASRRRIDLFIETARHKIPIEVKIHASDQDRQCYDYYKLTQNSNVFYLTLYGDVPSEASAKGLTPIMDNDSGEIEGYEEISQLSFSADILRWLDHCIQLPETIRIAPIREILLQFKDALCKLTGQVEGGAKMDIVKTISASTDAIKSALDIEKALPEVKGTILSNFISEIQRQFELNGYKPLPWGNGNAEDYYASHKQIEPGFYLEIAKFKKATAVFYVSVYHYLYYGFSFMDNITGNFLEIKDREKHLKNETSAFLFAISSVVKNNKRWSNVVAYVNITNNSQQEYDFKNFSSSCIELADNYIEEAKRIFPVLDAHYNAVKIKMEAVEK